MGMVLVIARADAARLAALRAAPDTVQEYILGEEAYESGDAIDFDKAWNVLHFLLTGHPDEVDHPLSLLPLEYEKIGEDFGYGPAQVISAQNVQTFAGELSKLSDEDLESRFEKLSLDDETVYLGGVLTKEDEPGWEYVSQNIPAFRHFLQRCVETQSAIVTLMQ
jgi:hypothetical protein